MTSKIVYDTHFNTNEWFVILGLGVGLCLMVILPRRFPRKLSILYFIFGMTFGALSDHNIGTVPVSLYDTSDTSAFDWADMPAISMYGPYSYLFFYLYDFLKVKLKWIPIYILSWALVSTVFEWAAVRAGVFHYGKGYWLGISFEIYLLIHSAMVLLFHLMRRAEVNE